MKVINGELMYDDYVNYDEWREAYREGIAAGVVTVVGDWVRDDADIHYEKMANVAAMLAEAEAIAAAAAPAVAEGWLAIEAAMAPARPALVAMAMR